MDRTLLSTISCFDCEIKTVASLDRVESLIFVGSSARMYGERLTPEQRETIASHFRSVE